MSTWLKLLPMELDGINESEIIEPDHPMEKSAAPVGEMSSLSKRLYTLGRLLEKDANQYNLDASFCTDKVEKPKLKAKSYELMTKAGVLKSLMWISIKDELGLWNDHVAVREGFKVVKLSADEDGPPPIIKRILGLE